MISRYPQSPPVPTRAPSVAADCCLCCAALSYPLDLLPVWQYSSYQSSPTPRLPTPLLLCPSPPSTPPLLLLLLFVLSQVGSNAGNFAGLLLADDEGGCSSGPEGGVDAHHRHHCPSCCSREDTDRQVDGTRLDWTGQHAQRPRRIQNQIIYTYPLGSHPACLPAITSIKASVKKIYGYMCSAANKPQQVQVLVHGVRSLLEAPNACWHNRGPRPHLMSTTHIAATPTRVSIEGATEERDARRSRRRCQDRGLRHDATALSRLTTSRGHPGASPTRAYVPRPSWRNKQFMGLFLSRTHRTNPVSLLLAVSCNILPAWLGWPETGAFPLESSHHPLLRGELTPHLTPRRDKSSSQLRHDGLILDPPCHTHQIG
ncbi:hypothetical protein LA080_007787 [Diaporthe eres]|nr:hypothetical protein LA080_007787 [Diaporthe eres]